MKLSVKLQKDIVEFLKSIPALYDADSQRAFLYDAGIDKQLQEQIPFGKPRAQFILLLVSMIQDYGTLSDGRNTIIAILETAKNYVGQDRQIYCDSLLQNLKKEGIHSSSTTATTILKSLIPRSRDIFIGREVELSKFEEYLKSSNIISIEGIAGIGKTELAAKSIETFQLAHRVNWFDCTSDSKFDSLIATSGFEDFLKIEHKTEQTKYSGFTDLLDKSEQFIFLDNFQDIVDNSFFTFIRFAERRLRKAKLILITREHPKNILTSPVKMDGLKNDEALKYAKLIVQKFYPDININEKELQNICYSLKGHPLGIILAIQLIYFSETPVDIVQTLVEEDGEFLAHQLLNRIFSYSGNKFSEEQEFMTVFSVFRGKVEKDALIHLFQGRDFKRILSELIRKFMINYNRSDNFYETHPLIREFCYNRLIDKLYWHRKASEFFKKKRTEQIDPILEEKIYYHLVESEQWQEIKELICEKGERLIRTGHIKLIEGMIDKVEAFGIHVPQFSIFKGDIAQIAGDWDKSLEHFKTVFSDPEVNEIFKAEALNKTGVIFWFKGELEKALPYYEKAYMTYQNLNNLRGMADVLDNIGGILSTQANLTEALSKYSESLKIQEAIGNKSGIATSLGNIGSIFYAQGKFDEALEKYQQSLKIKEQIGDKLVIGFSLGWIGLILVAKGDLERAEENFQKGLKLSEEIGDKLGVGLSLNQIGFLRLNQNKLEEALEAFQRSLQIREELDDNLRIHANYRNIGVVYKKQKNYFLALKNLLIAQTMQYKMNMQNEERKTKEHISDIRQEIGLHEFQTMIFQIVEQYSDKLRPYWDIIKQSVEPLSAY